MAVRVKMVAVAGAAGVATALLASPGLPARAGGANPGAGAAITVNVDAAEHGRAINQNLVGVNQSVPAGVPAMQAIGPRWARIDASLEASYDCQHGTWDPSPLDSRVALARQEGAEPEVLVSYTPACLATGGPPGGNPNYSPPDPKRWVPLVHEMALHEIGAGVTTFEVWNEPDGFFWTGTLADYLKLYEETAAAITDAARHVGRGVAVHIGGPALTFPDPPWIEALLDDADRNHLPLDFLSWHYYANYPLVGPVGPIPAPPKGTPPAWYNPLTRAQTFGQQVAQVRAEVARHPALHPLLWLDEWNLDAGYDPRHDGSYDAALAAAVLDSLQQSGLDRSCFFRVADDAPGTLGNWGLLFSGASNFAPKPVYSAFRFWHQAAGDSLPVALPPGEDAADPVGRVGAVASADRGRRALSVLVYNFVPFDPTGQDGASPPTPYDHSVVVSVSGLAPGRYSLERQLVDGSHGGETVEHAAVDAGADGRLSVPFTLAGDGVTLIRMARP